MTRRRISVVVVLVATIALVFIAWLNREEPYNVQPPVDTVETPHEESAIAPLPDGNPVESRSEQESESSPQWGGVVLRGRVVDQYGREVVGASVACRLESRPNRLQSAASPPVASQSAVSQFTASQSAALEGMTDALGVFQFQIQKVGTYEISVSANGYLSPDVAHVPVAEGLSLRPVVIVVAELIQLRRRVENEFGEALTGVQVDLSLSHWSSFNQRFRIKDGDGIELTVPAGDLIHLEIAHGDYLDWDESYDSAELIPDPIVLRTGSGIRFVLKLPSESERAQGSQDYRLEVKGGHQSIRSTGSLHEDSIAVEHVGLPGGEYSYQFGVGPYEPIHGKVVLSENEIVELPYSPKLLGVFWVEVTDSGGRSVPDARILLHGLKNGSTSSAGRTDERGEARVLGLDREGLGVWVSAEGYAPDFVVEARPALKQERLQFVLAREAILEVTLLVTEEEPMPKGDISVNLEGHSTPGPFASQLSHAQRVFSGPAEFRGLIAGRYRVEYVAPNGRRSEQRVELVAGKKMSLEFEVLGDR